MTKRSSCSRHASLTRLVGVTVSCRREYVTTGKFFPTVNAVFLPLPVKQDKVADPHDILVELWTFLTPGCLRTHVQLRNENESQYPLHPNLYLLCLLLLKNSGECYSQCQLLKAQSWGSPPGLRLQHAKIILVSTSSWVHGARFAVLLRTGLLRISLPLVVMTSFSSRKDTILSCITQLLD